MVKKGQSLDIKHGAFKGHSGIVKGLSSEILIEIEIWGRKTEISLPYSDFGLKYTPKYNSFESMLNEFDTLYKLTAPLRYSRLNKGVTGESIDSVDEFKSLTIPEEFYRLMQWKNGFNNLPEGWMNEFKEDSWYELIPLNTSAHLMSIDLIVDTVKMWLDIRKESEAKKQPCYWRKGFIPFLMHQNYGLAVIDTVGHFDGQPGQIVYFDYKCANGYSVIHENLNKWLETELSLLKQGLLFSDEDFEAIADIRREINGYYTGRFKSEIPLDEVPVD